MNAVGQWIGDRHPGGAFWALICDRKRVGQPVPAHDRVRSTRLRDREIGLRWHQLKGTNVTAGALRAAHATLVGRDRRPAAVRPDWDRVDRRTARLVGGGRPCISKPRRVNERASIADGLREALRPLVVEVVSEELDRRTTRSPEWLTVEEYAQRRRTTPTAVRKKLERRQIPGAVRDGKRWLIPAAVPVDTVPGSDNTGRAPR